MVSRLNIHADHANIDSSSNERPCNPGLGKLLAAAAAILVLLVIGMEAFEGAEQGAITLVPAPQASSR